MPDRTAVAAICLHISAVVYVILAVLLLGLSFESDSGLEFFLAVASIGLVVGVEAVARALQRRRFWGWVAGLCVFAVYVPSLFLPLGAVGLWALLAPGSRAACGVGGAESGTASNAATNSTESIA